MDNYDGIKKKVRKLKRLEIRIRFGDEKNIPKSASLVWNDFFNLNDVNCCSVKYSLNGLAAMTKLEYRDVVDEFFYMVYYMFYNEIGMRQFFTYDPEVLSGLGLPYNAGYDDIKKKFRELSKKYHPDNGGSGADFIELTDKYNKLMNRK